MPYGSVKVDSIVTSTKTVTVDNVVTTGDTGMVTGAMIADGAISDADINASAAIAGSKLQAATTSSAGAVQLTDSTSSTSTTTAATPAAVKSAYDLASAALPILGGTMTGAITFNSGQTYPQVPANSKTAAYTLVVGDAGKHISITTGGVTIPSGVFSVGDAISIYNDSGSNQTITQGGSVTLRKAGTADTGNRTLAEYGLATVLCVASDTFVISGGGLS